MEDANGKNHKKGTNCKGPKIMQDTGVNTNNNHGVNIQRFKKSVSFGRDRDTKVAWSTGTTNKGNDTSRTMRKLPSLTYGSSEPTTVGDYITSTTNEHKR